MRSFAYLTLLAALTIGGSAFAQAEAPAAPDAEAPAAATMPGDARTEASEPAAPLPEEAAPVPSFQSRSAQRAGGPANELNTRDTRATEELPGGSAADAVAGRDLYHGHYCGRGQRGAGLAPTDALDAVCKRHDECYDAAARRSCACDAALRREALVVANTASLSRELRSRAASVAQAAELMGCEQP